QHCHDPAGNIPLAKNKDNACNNQRHIRDGMRFCIMPYAEDDDHIRRESERQRSDERLQRIGPEHQQEAVKTNKIKEKIISGTWQKPDDPVKLFDVVVWVICSELVRWHSAESR